jgi:Amt family ammonium transporter
MELTLERLEADLTVIYLMVASVLVFIMHPGFALVESGFTRAKNAANIIMKNVMTLTWGMIVYFLVGFGVMYGSQVAGLFGTDGFALMNLTAYEPVAGNLSIDFLYQAMFAATTATIVSGAVAERMKFGPYLWVVAFMTALVYPVVGAWKWGGGWLDQLGFMDFAGSSIVHMTGGVAALVAAAILGPRLGKYAEDGSVRVIPGHSVPLAALGVLLLFFGWFGFNGGSVLAMDAPLIADVLVNTALAGSAGGVLAAWYTRLRSGTYDVGMSLNGVLAGLVGVTAGADVLSVGGSLAVGAVAGVVVVLAIPLIDKLRVDDPVGAVSVHGVCGALGTLWVGIAHTGQGLLYGGGGALLGVQALGVLAVTAYVAIATALLMVALRATLGIRVSEEEEIEGLDIHEHGMYGYPEQARGPEPHSGPRTEESERPVPVGTGNRSALRSPA